MLEPNIKMSAKNKHSLSLLLLLLLLLFFLFSLLFFLLVSYVLLLYIHKLHRRQEAPNSVVGRRSKYDIQATVAMKQ